MDTPSFVVLGASGMAGHVVGRYLRERGYRVLELARGTATTAEMRLIDVFDREALLAFLSDVDVDVVVNAIGVLVRDSAENPDRAAYLNSYLPHLLESQFRLSPTRVFHLSTDCVFAGATGGYTEDAVPDGTSFYDRSKSLGELRNGKDVTIRTSIIGPEVRTGATGLLNWLLNARGLVDGYCDSIWNGLTTLQLAKEVERLAAMPHISGVVHPVPDATVSKYELLVLLRDIFGLKDVEVEPVPGKSANKSLVGTRTDYRPLPTDFATMLRELKTWMLDRPDLYARFPWFSRIEPA